MRPDGRQPECDATCLTRCVTWRTGRRGCRVAGGDPSEHRRRRGCHRPWRTRRSRRVSSTSASSGPPDSTIRPLTRMWTWSGLSSFEQPAVVRDREHAERVVGVVREILDPPRAVAQRVDVEAGVELVEDRDLRLEHGELQRLVALLLATRQVDVERAVQEPLLEADALGLGAQRSRAAPRCRVRDEASASPSTSSSITPGTSVGYCITRCSPATARSPCRQREHVDAVERDRAVE